VTLTPRIAALLLVPPLLWAGNSVLGRALAPQVSPLTLNALRWWAALLVLLPLGIGAVSSAARRAELRRRWRPLALLGLLGVGSYNSLQYLALQTSTAVNVTLIASSAPLWTLLLGTLFYGERVRGMQALGALLSMAGVAVVLLRGDAATLATLQLVPGDLWMLLAALAWSLYSWQLARPGPLLSGAQRPAWTWAEFLLVQTLFGTAFASAASVVELSLGGRPPPATPQMAWALLFLALGPSIAAYRCWGLGVTAVGPALAGFFGNLTPLFAALFSALWLGQPPQPYHAAAFALIVAGIAASNRR
jgi:drug/metabolite transporter (DMT)-like permease